MIIKANTEHVEWILRHRVEMFRSMGWTESDLSSTKTNTQRYLENEWDTENPEVLLKVDGLNIIGGCAVAYYRVLPDNRNPSGKCAYILNMFVEPEHRGKGYATELIRHVISSCKQKGVNKLSLHDTEMSRRIYEKEGFVLNNNYYQMFI